MTVGFVFPGQGSQSMGMLLDMVEAYPAILDTFEEASEVLDLDLWHLAVQGPVERMNQTEVTQPLVLTADVALWRLWLDESAGQKPAMVAGHSLGEYAALVAAEALEFTDAVALTAERGRLMQLASPVGVGAMAAIIGADRDNVEKLCEFARQDRVLDVANINSIGQIVIAGHADAVERAVASAREFGAKIAKILPVSVPSHCQLMHGAATAFEATLDQTDIAAPVLPVIHNADLSVHDDPVVIKQALLNQLTQPVPWVATVQLMLERGVDLFVECGPGQVLQGLMKRINKSVSMHGTSTPALWEQLNRVYEECS